MTGANRVRLSDASIRIDSMPIEGRDLRLNVGADERAALAERLALSKIDKLEVGLHAQRFKGGVRVTGRLEAAIVQPSVVSLEPVTQHISEPIDRIFLPGGERDFAGPAGAEVFVDLEGEDVPDHFEGPEANLSDLVVETLSLAIDLYPRSEGETIKGPAESDDERQSESPFARLRDFKPGGGQGPGS